ncbi:hypothetical protein [Bacillus sp. Y1]|nr:hypothetical protein [Bacillus sp. Y1]
METIVAEGHALQPDDAEKIKQQAIEKAVLSAEQLAKELVVNK